MGYVFDGVAKIISLTSGTTTLDVRDMYSRWKEWVIAEGSGYSLAFSIVGGDPIDSASGIYVTSYFFLENGWRVRPQEANHRLNVVSGVLLTSTGADPFIPTLGNYNVLVLYSQPIRSETIATGGTTGGGDTKEAIYEHFTTEGRQDTFKANVQPLATKADVYNASQL